MRRSQTWFTILSILAGAFLLVSFFIEQSSVRIAGAELLLWAERLFAALLFFAVADAAILQIRKVSEDGGMRVIRTIGFAVFLAVLLLGLIKGPEDGSFNRTVFFIQKTIESALAGLVCVSLIFAMYRLPSQKSSAMKTSFFIGLLVFLLIYSGVPKMFRLTETVSHIIEWLESIPQGAITGLLLGIALGGAVTGIRYILAGRIPPKEDK